MSRGRPKSNEEIKSKRISLLVRPSTYNAVEKIVYVNRDSINGLVNDFFDSYVANHADDVKKYDELFAKNE